MPIDGEMIDQGYRVEKIIRIEFHHDPGHGWYKVHKALLYQLGIQADITSYSYIDQAQEFVYLEEDCDASTLFNALDKQGIAHYVDPSGTYHPDPNPIRSMDNYAKPSRV